jgi:hypothetical protein
MRDGSAKDAAVLFVMKRDSGRQPRADNRHCPQSSMAAT